MVSLTRSTSLSTFFRSSLVGTILFSIMASNSPILATEPSLTIIDTRVPAAGAGISESTLSVATSTSGSSSFTSEPSLTNHLFIVASITPSPIAGNVIFILAINLCFNFFQLSFYPLSNLPQGGKVFTPSPKGEGREGGYLPNQFSYILNKRIG